MELNAIIKELEEARKNTWNNFFNKFEAAEDENNEWDEKDLAKLSRTIGKSKNVVEVLSKRNAIKKTSNKEKCASNTVINSDNDSVNTINFIIESKKMTKRKPRTERLKKRRSRLKINKSSSLRQRHFYNEVSSDEENLHKTFLTTDVDQLKQCYVQLEKYDIIQKNIKQNRLKETNKMIDNKFQINRLLDMSFCYNGAQKCDTEGDSLKTGYNEQNFTFKKSSSNSESLKNAEERTNSIVSNIFKGKRKFRRKIQSEKTKIKICDGTDRNNLITEDKNYGNEENKKMIARRNVLKNIKLSVLSSSDDEIINFKSYSQKNTYTKNSQNNKILEEVNGDKPDAQRKEIVQKNVTPEKIETANGNKKYISSEKSSFTKNAASSQNYNILEAGIGDKRGEEGKKMIVKKNVPPEKIETVDTNKKNKLSEKWAVLSSSDDEEITFESHSQKSRSPKKAASADFNEILEEGNDDKRADERKKMLIQKTVTPEKIGTVNKSKKYKLTEKLSVLNRSDDKEIIFKSYSQKHRTTKNTTNTQNNKLLEEGNGDKPNDEREEIIVKNNVTPEKIQTVNKNIKDNPSKKIGSTKNTTSLQNNMLEEGNRDKPNEAGKQIIDEKNVTPEKIETVNTNNKYMPSEKWTALSSSDDEQITFKSNSQKNRSSSHNNRKLDERNGDKSDEDRKEMIIKENVTPVTIRTIIRNKKYKLSEKLSVLSSSDDGITFKSYSQKRKSIKNTSSLQNNTRLEEGNRDKPDNEIKEKLVQKNVTPERIETVNRNTKYMPSEKSSSTKNTINTQNYKKLDERNRDKPNKERMEMIVEKNVRPEKTEIVNRNQKYKLSEKLSVLNSFDDEEITFKIYSQKNRSTKNTTRSQNSKLLKEGNVDKLDEELKEKVVQKIGTPEKIQTVNRNKKYKSSGKLSALSSSDDEQITFKSYSQKNRSTKKAENNKILKEGNGDKPDKEIKEIAVKNNITPEKIETDNWNKKYIQSEKCSSTKNTTRTQDDKTLEKVNDDEEITFKSYSQKNRSLKTAISSENNKMLEKENGDKPDKEVKEKIVKNNITPEKIETVNWNKKYKLSEKLSVLSSSDDEEITFKSCSQKRRSTKKAIYTQHNNVLVEMHNNKIDSNNLIVADNIYCNEENKEPVIRKNVSPLITETKKYMSSGKLSILSSSDDKELIFKNFTRKTRKKLINTQNNTNLEEGHRDDPDDKRKKRVVQKNVTPEKVGTVKRIKKYISSEKIGSTKNTSPQNKILEEDNRSKPDDERREMLVQKSIAPVKIETANRNKKYKLSKKWSVLSSSDDEGITFKSYSQKYRSTKNTTRSQNNKMLEGNGDKLDEEEKEKIVQKNVTPEKIETANRNKKYESSEKLSVLSSSDDEEITFKSYSQKNRSTKKATSSEQVNGQDGEGKEMTTQKNVIPEKIQTVNRNEKYKSSGKLLVPSSFDDEEFIFQNYSQKSRSTKKATNSENNKMFEEGNGDKLDEEEEKEKEVKKIGTPKKTETVNRNQKYKLLEKWSVLSSSNDEEITFISNSQKSRSSKKATRSENNKMLEERNGDKSDEEIVVKKNVTPEKIQTVNANKKYMSSGQLSVLSSSDDEEIIFKSYSQKRKSTKDATNTQVNKTNKNNLIVENNSNTNKENKEPVFKDITPKKNTLDSEKKYISSVKWSILSSSYDDNIFPSQKVKIMNKNNNINSEKRIHNDMVSSDSKLISKINNNKEKTPQTNDQKKLENKKLGKIIREMPEVEENNLYNKSNEKIDLIFEKSLRKNVSINNKIHSQNELMLKTNHFDNKFNQGRNKKDKIMINKDRNANKIFDADDFFSSDSSSDEDIIKTSSNMDEIKPKRQSKDDNEQKDSSSSEIKTECKIIENQLNKNEKDASILTPLIEEIPKCQTEDSNFSKLKTNGEIIENQPNKNEKNISILGRLSEEMSDDSDSNLDNFVMMNGLKKINKEFKKNFFDRVSKKNNSNKLTINKIQFTSKSKSAMVNENNLPNKKPDKISHNIKEDNFKVPVSTRKCSRNSSRNKLKPTESKIDKPIFQTPKKFFDFDDNLVCSTPLTNRKRKIDFDVSAILCDDNNENRRKKRRKEEDSLIKENDCKVLENASLII